MTLFFTLFALLLVSFVVFSATVRHLCILVLAEIGYGLAQTIIALLNLVVRLTHILLHYALKPFAEAMQKLAQECEWELAMPKETEVSTGESVADHA